MEVYQGWHAHVRPMALMGFDCEGPRRLALYEVVGGRFVIMQGHAVGNRFDRRAWEGRTLAGTVAESEAAARAWFSARAVQLGAHPLPASERNQEMREAAVWDHLVFGPFSEREPLPASDLEAAAWSRWVQCSTAVAEAQSSAPLETRIAKFLQEGLQAATAITNRDCGMWARLLATVAPALQDELASVGGILANYPADEAAVALLQALPSQELDTLQDWIDRSWLEYRRSPQFSVPNYPWAIRLSVRQMLETVLRRQQALVSLWLNADAAVPAWQALGRE